MKDIISKLANKHKVSPAKIARQLKMGTKVEHEHTKSDEKAQKIATDHLGEVPDYYSKLKKYVESKNYGEVSEARRKDPKQEIQRLTTRIENNSDKKDLTADTPKNEKINDQNERIMGALNAIRISRTGENPAKTKSMSSEREYGVGFRDMAGHLNRQLEKSNMAQFKNEFIRPIRLRGY